MHPHYEDQQCIQNAVDDISIAMEETLTLPEEEEFTLVGTLLTDKVIKFNFMQETLATVWRPGRGMIVKEVATNLFLFSFFHRKDMRRILNDGPWSYDQSLLVLKLLGENESPFEADLSKAEF